jgi:hypothetical protein
MRNAPHARGLNLEFLSFWNSESTERSAFSEISVLVNRFLVNLLARKLFDFFRVQRYNIKD